MIPKPFCSLFLNFYFVPIKNELSETTQLLNPFNFGDLISCTVNKLIKGTQNIIRPHKVKFLIRFSSYICNVSRNVFAG